jgi:hypothetical protein
LDTNFIMYSFNTYLHHYALFILNRISEYIIKIVTSKVNKHPNGALGWI